MAIDDYKKAKDFSSTSIQAQENIDALKRKLKNCSETIAKKGYIKAKRLSYLVQTLESVKNIPLDSTDIQNLQNEQNNKKPAAIMHYENVQSVSQLKAGENNGKR